MKNNLENNVSSEKIEIIIKFEDFMFNDSKTLEIKKYYAKNISISDVIEDLKKFFLKEVNDVSILNNNMLFSDCFNIIVDGNFVSYINRDAYALENNCVVKFMPTLTGG